MIGGDWSAEYMNMKAKLFRRMRNVKGKTMKEASNGDSPHEYQKAVEGDWIIASGDGFTCPMYFVEYTDNGAARFNVDPEKAHKYRSDIAAWGEVRRMNKRGEAAIAMTLSAAKRREEKE